MMLGDMTTAPATAPPVAAPGFITGLTAWKSPGVAFSALGTTLSNFSASFSGAALPVSLGLWVPPLALAAVLIGMGKKGRR